MPSTSKALERAVLDEHRAIQRKGSTVSRFGLGITNCRPAAEVIEHVRRAEQLGAEVAFIAEDIYCRDAFQLAVLAAAETESIRLATGVVNPYTRNPTSLAMAIATLDEVSGGRAILGLGPSSPSLIEDQMGIPMGKPAGVMRETVHILRSLLAGDEMNFEGERFVYHGAKLQTTPIQSRIPIFFAAMGPRTLRLAGRLADGVLLNVGASTEYVRWAVDQVHVGAVQEGRDPAEITIAAWLTAYITNDYAAGLERARGWLASMLSIPRQGELLLEHAGGEISILSKIREHSHAYPHGGDRTAAAQYVPPEMAERMALIGDKEQVLRRVAEYRDAGVQLPVLGPSALKSVLTSH